MNVPTFQEVTTYGELKTQVDAFSAAGGYIHATSIEHHRTMLCSFVFWKKPSDFEDTDDYHRCVLYILAIQYCGVNTRDIIGHTALFYLLRDATATNQLLDEFLRRGACLAEGHQFIDKPYRGPSNNFTILSMIIEHPPSLQKQLFVQDILSNRHKFKALLEVKSRPFGVVPDPFIRDRFVTPLELSLLYNDTPLTIYLLNMGAKVDVDFLRIVPHQKRRLLERWAKDPLSMSVGVLPMVSKSRYFTPGTRSNARGQAKSARSEVDLPGDVGDHIASFLASPEVAASKRTILSVKGGSRRKLTILSVKGRSRRKRTQQLRSRQRAIKYYQ